MAEATSLEEYYGKWDKFADDLEDDDGKNDKEPSLPFPSRAGASGYEFRDGHKTPFPEITNAEDETDDAAALRVAKERLESGRQVFAEGTVWAAQSAVDCWGQGLLAIERGKNLRKYRKARVEGGTATEADFALEALERQDEAALAAISEPADEAAADGGSSGGFVRRMPVDSDHVAVQLPLRLNVAQALLKLRQFERCIRYCDGALELDPNSTKALWRKAKAVWGIRNPGLARLTLNRLLELDADNAAALAMLREIAAEEARKKARRLGANHRGAKSAAAEALAAEAEARASTAADGDAAAAYWSDAALRAAAEQEVSEEEDDDEAPLPFMDRLRLVRELCCRRRPKDKLL